MGRNCKLVHIVFAKKGAMSLWQGNFLRHRKPQAVPIPRNSTRGANAEREESTTTTHIVQPLRAAEINASEKPPQKGAQLALSNARAATRSPPHSRLCVHPPTSTANKVQPSAKAPIARILFRRPLVPLTPLQPAFETFHHDHRKAAASRVRWLRSAYDVARSETRLTSARISGFATWRVVHHHHHHHTKVFAFLPRLGTWAFLACW